MSVEVQCRVMQNSLCLYVSDLGCVASNEPLDLTLDFEMCTV